MFINENYVYKLNFLYENKFKQALFCQFVNNGKKLFTH